MSVSVCVYVCVRVALFIQHATRLRLITFSSVACWTVTYSSTLSHKRHDFQKEVIEHKTCVLIFYITMAKTFLILRR
jgi:hypothetical protein